MLILGSFHANNPSRVRVSRRSKKKNMLNNTNSLAFQKLCGWNNYCEIEQERLRMGVSKNRGTPKSSISIGFSIINHPFWGPTPIFGNTHINLDGRTCRLKGSPWFQTRLVPPAPPWNVVRPHQGKHVPAMEIDVLGKWLQLTFSQIQRSSKDLKGISKQLHKGRREKARWKLSGPYGGNWVDPMEKGPFPDGASAYKLNTTYISADGRYGLCLTEMVCFLLIGWLSGRVWWVPRRRMVSIHTSSIQRGVIRHHICKFLCITYPPTTRSSALCWENSLLLASSTGRLIHRIY